MSGGPKTWNWASTEPAGSVQWGGRELGSGGKATRSGRSVIVTTPRHGLSSRRLARCALFGGQCCCVLERRPCPLLHTVVGFRQTAVYPDVPAHDTSLHRLEWSASLDLD